MANAAPELPSTPALRSVPALLTDRASLGAVVLAASIPFVFLHEQHQRWGTFGIDVGSTTVDVRPSDLAVLLVVVAAVVSAVRLGAAPLLRARWLWIFGAALLAWLAFGALRPAAVDDDEFASHFVTFAKLCEYALLAVAVPLLVRRRDDLVIFLGALVLWSVAATAVALLQFFGLDVFDAWNAGWRQPSFLGHHDLAALSAIALSLAAGGIVASRRNLPVPSLFVPALVAGLLGLVLAGSVAAAGGLAVGMLAVAIASRARFAPSARQLAALAAVVLAVAGGVAAVRGDALEDFLRFLGVRDDAPVGVETYSQRTVLAYIGLRIFQDNPVAGVSAGSARPLRRSSSRTCRTRASASRTSWSSRFRLARIAGASRTSTSRCSPTPGSSASPCSSRSAARRSCSHGERRDALPRHGPSGQASCRSARS